MFNIIMLDVDSKDISSGLSCPPPAFLDHDYLTTLSSRLSKGGMFVLNLVCRDSVLRSEIVSKLSSLWQCVVSYKLEEEVNEVIFCTNNDKLKSSEAIKSFNQAFKLVNDHVKKVLRDDDELIDLEDAMKLLKVQH